MFEQQTPPPARSTSPFVTKSALTHLSQTSRYFNYPKRYVIVELMHRASRRPAMERDAASTLSRGIDHPRQISEINSAFPPRVNDERKVAEVREAARRVKAMT